MTIHCQFITVIVPVSVLNEKFPGGLDAFRNLRPTDTFCTDGYLASYSFMGPPSSNPFAHSLEEKGLVLWSGVEGLDLQFADVAVVDQFFGPPLPCEWLEAEQLEYQWVARLKGTPAGEITYMDSMDAGEIESIEAGIESAKNARLSVFNALPQFVREMSDYDRRQYFENKKIALRIQSAKRSAWIWSICGGIVSLVTLIAKLGGGHNAIVGLFPLIYGVIKLRESKDLEARFNRGDFTLPK